MYLGLTDSDMRTMLEKYDILPKKESVYLHMAFKKNFKTFDVADLKKIVRANGGSGVGTKEELLTLINIFDKNNINGKRK